MMGHKIAQLPLDMGHQVSKEPLPVFFVDLEVKENNKEIFKVNKVHSMEVTIEPPTKEIDSTM
jgi:hypothetical protein